MPTRPTDKPSPNSQPISTIALAPKSRGILIGETGSGKSTLAERLMAHWLATGKNPRLLVIDSKPRFRAELELNGMTTRASKRYKGMDHGASIPRSYVLPLNNPRAELKQVWRLGGHTAIAQVEELSDLPALEATMRAFYQDARSSYDQLVYIDELPDFFGSSAAFGKGHAVLKLVRSGREKGVAVLAAAQRPRSIPPAVMTETTNLYLFNLSFANDWKHIQEMGLPPNLAPPTEEHVFLFYNKHKRQSGVHKLQM